MLSLLNADTYARQISATTERLESKVKSLISKADAESVHDTRTTIRRVQALFALLPKNVRRKSKVADYLSNAKKTFKETSEIRDIDITVLKLKQFLEIQPGLSDFTAKLDERRKKKLQSARRAAKSFEKKGYPKIKLQQIAEQKLAKRETKVTSRLRTELKTQIKSVMRKASLEELHDFRKNCKMLRYTLEVDSARNKKKIETLQKLQEILGAFLDNSTTIRLLSDSSLGESAVFIVTKLKLENESARAAMQQMVRSELQPLIDSEINQALEVHSVV